MHKRRGSMTRIVSVDTGGTFTDLVSYEFESRDLAFSKSLTTYGDLVEGIADCLAKSQVDLGSASFLKHGTTLVINTLIERKGARTGLVVTEGTRDVLVEKGAVARIESSLPDEKADVVYEGGTLMPGLVDAHVHVHGSAHAHKFTCAHARTRTRAHAPTRTRAHAHTRTCAHAHKRTRTRT